MGITAEDIWEGVCSIRKQSPLVHNITNYVVMNTTANALLSLGASPVMAHAVDEIDDMVSIAGSLVINIGTLSEHWVSAMLRAAAKARERRIPIILDPVGAGATRYRTETSLELIEKLPPSIIRGNASEIMALVTAEAKTKGVDSTVSSGAALDAAQYLSATYGSVVSVSGATDYIISPNTIIKIQNGHAMMSRVTGLGCTASALCGAFAAVTSDHLLAVTQAMAVMGISGEIAAEKADGPGSLQMIFLDTLYNLTESDIKRYLKIGE